MTRGSTKIFGYGALAMATAVIASVSVPGCTPKNGRVAESGVSVVAPGESPAQALEGASPAPDRTWARCKLGNDTVNGLIRDMAEPGGLGTPVTVAYVKVYTFRNNGGQPLPDPEGADTPPEGPHTGRVYCINPTDTQDPTPVRQTDNIGGGGSTLDLLDLEDASLRYRLNGGVERRDCDAVEGASECLKFIPQP